MKILGAIFAGGQSSRFGSDKALIEIDGELLLDRIIQMLKPQCDEVAIVGRAWRELRSISDKPRTGMGPLGALCGALIEARQLGFDTVVTAGCDLPIIPDDLPDLLLPGPSIIKGQPLLGCWPSDLGCKLLDHLERQEDRSFRGWIAESNARSVSLAAPLPNLNTQQDLAAYMETRQS